MVDVNMKFKVTIYISILCLPVLVRSGILYPKITKTRDLLQLDGLWKFTLSNNVSLSETDSLSGIYNDKDLHIMPVPASYNDILTTLEGRDHVGSVRYERSFFIPKEWFNKKYRIWLRFGSVCVSARVYVNKQLAVSNKIGHLPFQTEITSLLVHDENVVSVIVYNNLTDTTIPQGETVISPGGQEKQTYKFDFFNYAGIHRPVVLYKTPRVYIDDIDISTSITNNLAIVGYEIKIGGTENESWNYSKPKYTVTILNQHKQIIATHTDDVKNDNTVRGSLQISNVILWWPYLMSNEPGYQYTLVVELKEDVLVDQYKQLFGVRKLSWNNDTFEINGKKIYINGIGRHEDSDIRGRGLDFPILIRDHNLLRWLGVNCYRTTHYPYAEEIMDLADSLGIMIIDEAPSVVTNHFSNGLLANHKTSLTELHKRDKNRPSVIIWSIANEPMLKNSRSLGYFKKVIEHMKSLDISRPITLVNFYTLNNSVNLFQYLDIISLNRYQGWYQNPGDVKAITPEIIKEVKEWRETYQKPVLLTEYGADVVEGTHFLPSFIWSEEFQLDVMSNFFRAFDKLMEENWFIGEMIWNFADFKTSQDIRRVGGNRKGIFTRQRQPKASAFLLRKRYWLLAKYFYNVTLPRDLDRYVLDNRLSHKDEL